jgi:putative aldouronate transport system substrate-binding protein
MKKNIFLVVFLLIMAGTVFAAGGGQQGTGSAPGRTRQPKGTLPLADGKTSFTVFIGGGGTPGTSSFAYADNTFTKRVVNETGIMLDITSAGGVANRQERLNLLLSTGDYPEIIISEGISLNDLNYYAAQGIFLPLDQYDPMGYPNIKAAYDEFPALNEVTRGTDGKLYGLPQVNDCIHCTYGQGRIFYYMPWARDNKRKVPETLDEFTAYLRWIRDTDLNQNGRKDEIPMAFDKENIKNVIAFFAKSYMPFVWTSSYFGLALNNRVVVEQYKDSRFRESLAYLAGLYKEGLIMRDSFTIDVNQMRALAGSKPAVVGVPALNWVQGYATHLAIPGVETFNLPPLKGPNGQQNAGNQDPWSIMSPMYFITDKCKDPELAIALYDYLINFDVELDGYTGPKGIGWNDPDPGAISLMAEKPIWKALVNYGTQPHNSSWEQANPMIRSTAFRLGAQATGALEAKEWLTTGNPALVDQMLNNGTYTQMFFYFSTLEVLKYGMPNDLFIPPLALNDDDNARLSDINAVLEPYKEQACVEFITGIRNIASDTDWNTYLTDLNRMGSNDLVRIIQKYIKK